ncbi:MAG: type III-B CRISPR module-associated protein Cmr5 [Candidatus Brocadia sp. WS118]|nr:MAG: type III-B CRISPR module-associated protein Cmr5 [Candidatus Brocadia sp. WS118]
MSKANRNALERGRAEFAYQRAKKVKDSYDDISGNYKSYVKKLPMLIKTNGLGAALAFIYSKGWQKKKSEKPYAYKLLYEDIADWLRSDEKQLIKLENNEKLIEGVISLDSSTYRAVTVEVLAFLAWLLRFADGLIEKEEAEE